MPVAHSTVKRLSVAVVKLYYSLCCLLVSRHGILQKTVSIHLDFCQITSPLHQYSPSELFKRRQSLGEGGEFMSVLLGLCICVYSIAVMNTLKYQP